MEFDGVIYCHYSFQKEERKSNGFTYMRPTPGSKKMDLHSRMRNRRKPPRGMYMNQEDLMAIATGPPGQGEMLLRQLDGELVALKRQVSIEYCVKSDYIVERAGMMGRTSG